MRQTTVLFIILLFLANFLFAQTKFTNGFNTGYKKGYCQDQGVGCIEPTPPIAPIPKVGESYDNYTDGYNRGFQMGLSAQKSNSSNSNSNSTDRTRYKTAEPKFVDNVIYQAPISQMKASLETADKAYEKKLEFNSSYSKTLKQRITIVKAKTEDSLIIKGLNQTLDYINTLLELEPHWINIVKLELIKVENSVIDIETFTALSQTKKSYSESLQNEVYGLKAKTSLRNGPSEDYEKIVNQKASSIQKKTIYVSLSNISSKVKIESEKDGWSKIIENNEPYTSGWIKSAYILKREENNIPNKISVDFQAINKLLQEGKYQKSINLIDEYLKNSGTKSLYGIRGTANYLLKNYSEAISDITKSAETNSEIKPDFLFYRALAKSEVGDFYGSISDYDLIIAKEDSKGQMYDMATVYNNKAYSYVGLKQYKKAIPFVTKAIKLNKSKWFIWDTRAEIYLNTEEYGKAINDATKAIQLQENANTFYIRGLAHIKRNEKTLGCKDLSRAGELGKSEAYEEIKKHCN